MKKISLIIALALSAQVIFSGCSVLKKKTDQTTQQSAQTQTDTSKTSEVADKNNDTTSNDSKTTEAGNDKNSTITKNANKDQASGSSSNLTNISKEEILNYSTMTKATLIKTLGKDYKIQDNALTFPNGLSFYGLSNNDSKPTIIKFNNNVEIMGIKNGMTFDEVQSVLGKTSVVETYLGTKTNKVYKIQYVYGKDVLKVISAKNDGKDSFVEVCRQ